MEEDEVNGEIEPMEVEEEPIEESEEQETEVFEDEMNVDDYLHIEQHNYIINPCLSDQTNGSDMDLDPYRANQETEEEMTMQANIETELREYEEVMRIQEEDDAYQSSLNDSLTAIDTQGVVPEFRRGRKGRDQAIC